MENEDYEGYDGEAHTFSDGGSSGRSRSARQDGVINTHDTGYGRIAVNGSSGADVINANRYASHGQTHVWAGRGEDTINMVFDTIDTYKKGHHVRGDQNGSDEQSKDVYRFAGINNVSGTVVGRLENFDASRDEIWIEDYRLDLNNLSAAPYDVKIVEHNGSHNIEGGSEPQQWLLITTASGGHIFYALEGARVDMENDGETPLGEQEAHFVEETDSYSLPNFSQMRSVRYVDNVVVVPAGAIQALEDRGLVSGQDFRIVNDYDTVSTDVLQIISGSSGIDLIAAGLNNDTVRARAGDDFVWGGSGHDLILGHAGSDRLFGGTGKDTLIGGSKADLLEGGHDNDSLAGNAGADILKGNKGQDTLSGHRGNDRLNGGSQSDVLIGGQGNDTLRGGNGSDTFVFFANQGSDVISDFHKSQGDLIDLSGIAGITSLSELTIVRSGSDTVIDYGSGTLTLNGIMPSQLTADDFIF